MKISIEQNEHYFAGYKTSQVGELLITRVTTLSDVSVGHSNFYNSYKLLHISSFEGYHSVFSPDPPPPVLFHRQ